MKLHKRFLNIENLIWLDPVTKRFLRKNIDPVFGFPNIVRNSWSTAFDLLEKGAVKIKW